MIAIATKLLLTLTHYLTVREYRHGGSPQILQAAVAGKINRQQIAKIISIRYQAAHFFEDMLRLILEEITASSLRPDAKQALDHSVRANLQEELGEVTEYGGPHRHGRRQLLEALGINYEQWVSQLGNYDVLGQLHPAVERLLTGIRGLIKVHPLVGVSMLMHYEDRISLDGQGDYYLLLRGFGRLFRGRTYQREDINCPFVSDDGIYREGDALWHIYSHAQHDEHHAKLATDGLLKAVSSWQDLKLVLIGLWATKQIINNFWKEVENVVAL